MEINENQCVGCPRELGCNDLCRYKNVTLTVCDVCREPAEYIIDGSDYCAECATEYIIKELRKWCDVIELAELGNIEITKIKD